MNVQTAQQAGVLYERLLWKILKAIPRPGHCYIKGNDIREHHFLQLYGNSLGGRPTARRQLAILHHGKRLRGKAGTVLIGVDIIETELPDDRAAERPEDSFVAHV